MSFGSAIKETSNTSPHGDAVLNLKGLKAVGEFLGGKSIRICYGLELAAKALQQNDLGLTKELLSELQAVLIGQAGLNFEATSLALEEALEHRIKTGTENSFVKKDGKPETITEVLKRVHCARNIRQTMKGAINPIGSLCEIHEAVYYLALMTQETDPTNSEERLASIKHHLVTAYGAVNPRVYGSSPDIIFSSMLE